MTSDTHNESDEDEFTPYATISKSEIEAEDADWANLESYVGLLREALSDSESRRDDLDSIDKKDNWPEISGSEFEPNGWVGQFVEGVEVKPWKLEDDEFPKLLQDIQEWVELLGADTISSAVPASIEQLIDADVRISSYSRALIDQTERILAGRPPTEVHRQTDRGQSVKGQLNAQQTMQLQATGTAQFVSTRVSFTQDTPAARLLVRFHVALGREMRRLAEAYDYYGDIFSDRLSYHRSLLSRPPFANLVEPAIEQDSTDPQLLAEIRSEVGPAMQRVVDLWEAFQHQMSLQATLEDHFDMMVKPMETTYELWCLGELLEVLTELTGHPPSTLDIAKKYSFGDHVELHYDRDMYNHSLYFSDESTFPHKTGRPDFALCVNGDVVWIGDAKYKRGSTRLSVDLGDTQRFLTYLMDLLDPAKQTQSAFLYPAKDTSPYEIQVQAYTIDCLPMRPNIQGYRTALGNYLSPLLPEAL